MPRKVLVLMLLFLYMHRIDLKSSKAANFLSIFIQIMPKTVRSMEICYKINDKETGLLHYIVCSTTFELISVRRQKNNCFDS